MNDALPIEVSNFLGSKEKIQIISRIFSKKEDLDDLIDNTSQIVIEIIQPYYASINKSVRPAVFNFLLEPLKNSNFYSLCSDNIKFEVLLSEYGLVTSYNDGGIYFKRQDIKECYEHKIRHPEKFQSHFKGVGYGIGTLRLYEMADLIYIDTDSGTLYTGMSIKNSVFRKL